MKTLITIVLLLGISFHSCAIKPDTVYVSTPFDHGMHIIETDIYTADSFSIRTWIFNPSVEDSNTQTLIIAGSDAGNMSYTIGHAANLALNGFRVVTFDYRGFGRSQAFTFYPDQYYCAEFERDLEAVVDYCYLKYGKKLNILSNSLGSLVTLNVAKQNHQKIRALIFDGLVAEPNEVIKRVNKLKNKHIKELEANEEIFVIPDSINVLVFSGNKDQYTTTEDVLKFQEKNHNCQVFIYNGGHLETPQALNPLYYRFISSFIDF